VTDERSRTCIKEGRDDWSRKALRDRSRCCHQAVDAGFILRPEADEMIAEAQQSTIGINAT
jgi:hypothetical protein